MHHAVLRRGVAVAWIACCAALAGCAGAGGGIAVPSDPARFEGWYRGSQIPLSISTPNCRAGRTREVWFEVENGVVEMRYARHRRNARKRSLVGGVSADGVLAMRHGDSERHVSGRIEDGRLTAATVQDPQHIATIRSGEKAACGFRYEARKLDAPEPAGMRPPRR